MSIQKKLVLTFLTFSGVLIISMSLLVKWSFHNNFREYVKQQNLARMQEASERLADFHQERGNWDELRNNPRSQRHLLNRPLPPPEPMPPKHEREDHRPPEPSSPPPMPLFFLLDEDKHLVMGREPKSIDHESLIPVEVDGNTVGYIGLNLEPRGFNRMDERFARRQGEQLIYISITAIILSLLFAWPISQLLVRRLNRLGQHIQHLGEGRYDERVSMGGNDELSQLGNHLNHLALMLQKTELSRRKWVADISHELRTPLATLRAQLEAIEDGIHQYNDVTHQRLTKQTLRLQQLVEDLYQLSLADVGALQYRMQDVDAKALIEECVQSFSNRFAQTGLTLNCSVKKPITLLIDPQRIQQLLSNLLENSLRYTNAPGSTVVKGEVADGQFVLTVEDSAPGVNTAQLAQLFDRFYRGESSRNRDSGGAGLGLNLCRSIIEAHNGTIVAEPSSLGGLKITVTIPMEGK